MTIKKENIIHLDQHSHPLSAKAEIDEILKVASETDEEYSVYCPNQEILDFFKSKMNNQKIELKLS